MGASSGGIESFMEIVSGLPRDLPAAVFVVLHVSPRGTTQFPEILNRAGPLPAAHALDREPIRRGRIYVAPPDLHLLLRNETIRLVRGPPRKTILGGNRCHVSYSGARLRSTRCRCSAFRGSR
ncbi:MAG TPA: chemotaxis protein CheB [Candidatus Binatia bacterium]|jgi:two-component system, chemotaxis family, protein-glutamate methylesterase/glutaminase|nr:chemotaxis protein CheB [Candidatus Binatia bacterium]